MSPESSPSGYWMSSHDERPESMIVAGRIPEPRSRFGVSIPPWPDSMIDPSDVEIARWSALWNHPQARAWADNDQDVAVAALVRLEQRCRANGPNSKTRRAELELLRHELGLEL